MRRAVLQDLLRPAIPARLLLLLRLLRRAAAAAKKGARDRAAKPGATSDACRRRKRSHDRR